MKMFSIEQLEKTKKYYEEFIQKIKSNLQESYDEKDRQMVMHDIRIRLFKPSEIRVEENGYVKELESIEMRIEHDTRLVIKREKELEELNKMIENLKCEHSE
jgi:prefoldin subunit 5